MTAPDLLESVLNARPGELTLLPDHAGLKLVITVPDLNACGSMFFVGRDEAAAFAAFYDRWRRAMATATPRCACGDLQTSHDMAKKRQAKQLCSRSGCECTGWRLAGWEQ